MMSAQCQSFALGPNVFIGISNKYLILHQYSVLLLSSWLCMQSIIWIILVNTGLINYLFHVSNHWPFCIDIDNYYKEK